MKNKISNIIKNLDPKIFGVNIIKINSFRKLGIGESNLNYILNISNKKFLCRINIDLEMKDKLKKEYNNLKKIQKLKISPKPIYFNKSPEFTIIEYLEGKPLKKNIKITESQIKNLAKIVAKIHRIKISNMKKEEHTYKYYFDESKDYFKYIKKYTNNIPTELKKTNEILKKIVPKKENKKIGLIHGDICPQNVIETGKHINLIDWESVKMSETAKDIANIFVNFKLNKKETQLFVKEYQIIKKDETILQRTKKHEVLLRYLFMLWEIVRTLEIINKYLPEEYLKKTTPEEHIKEAKKQYRELKKLIDVPEINIEEIIKK